jgi:UDP-GlcNAc:undecaprenyl-phosphate GlcNAc-1-phosphate transferase
MADFAVLLGLAALSAALTWGVIHVRIIDIPNPRSSHDRPVPRAGGIAIVATFFAGLAWTGIGPLGGLAAAAGVVALVGLADDLGWLGVWAKLAGQTVAAVVLVKSGVVVHDVGPFENIGWWGVPITLLWVVAMTNLVNFMDGLDGLVGGSAAIAALAFAALALPTSPVAALAAAVLGAGCIGFTIFNVPKARIFMGDVGSEFLGFLLAALAVYASDGDAGHTSFLIMPLLMFHFIFDTCFTFRRRLRDGEKVTQAHRGHLYQLLNRLGASHFQVSLLHWAIGILQALGAWAMLSIPGIDRILVFLPYLAIEATYAALVMRAVRRRGIQPG